MQSTSEGRFESNAQDSEEGPRKPYSDLLALSRVSTAVSGLRELNAILNVALNTLLEIMNGTIGGILLTHEQTQRSHIKSIVAYPINILRYEVKSSINRR